MCVTPRVPVPSPPLDSGSHRGNCDRRRGAKSQRVLRQHKVVLEELGEQAQLQEVVEHSKEAQASEATVRSTEAAIATCSAEFNSLEADTAAYATS